MPKGINLMGNRRTKMLKNKRKYDIVCIANYFFIIRYIKNAKFNYTFMQKIATVAFILKNRDRLIILQF